MRGLVYRQQQAPELRRWGTSRQSLIVAVERMLLSVFLRMGEAEDAIRSRESARDAGDRSTAGAVSGSPPTQFVGRVEDLVPAALRALRDAGWPGGELVTINARPGRPRFRRRKTAQVAGWAVGSFTYHDHHSKSGEGHMRPVYLLADGQWIGGWYDGLPVPRRFSEVLESVRGQSFGPRSHGLRSETPRGVIDGLEHIANGEYADELQHSQPSRKRRAEIAEGQAWRAKRRETRSTSGSPVTKDDFFRSIDREDLIG